MGRITNWTDYHAWPVSGERMRAAHLVLSEPEHAQLLAAAEADGADYIVAREAIERAALAMPDGLALQWLAGVYSLSPAQAETVLKTLKILKILPPPAAA